jgi:hypothetical protein
MKRIRGPQVSRLRVYLEAIYSYHFCIVALLSIISTAGTFCTYSRLTQRAAGVKGLRYAPPKVVCPQGSSCPILHQILSQCTSRLRAHHRSRHLRSPISCSDCAACVSLDISTCCVYAPYRVCHLGVAPRLDRAAGRAEPLRSTAPDRRPLYGWFSFRALTNFTCPTRKPNMRWVNQVALVRPMGYGFRKI